MQNSTLHILVVSVRFFCPKNKIPLLLDPNRSICKPLTDMVSCTVCLTVK